MGSSYAGKNEICRRHMINNIRIPMDLRSQCGCFSPDMEEDLNETFLALLVEEMHRIKMKSVRNIEWDRMFIIGPEFNPKKFTAVFRARIDSKDMAIKECDNHIQLA
jgi:hypothetical protein